MGSHTTVWRAPGMRHRLLYTIAGTAVLSIVLLLLLAGAGAAQTDPPATGDWTVSDTTLVTDRTVDLHGDLTVTSSGSLTLRNVTLRIHLTSDGEHGIEVQTGGSLVIEDNDDDASTTDDASEVDSQPNTRSYYFIVRSGTSLRISNSFVYRCGHTGSVGNERLGLFVGTDDATIEGTIIDDCLHGLVLDHATITVTDSTVSNCTYHGVNAQDSDLTLTRVTMADNGYEGARIVRGDALLDGCWVGGNRNGLQVRTGANVTIDGTVVKGNTDGLLMQIDANVIVTGSTFRGQGQYGIHAENRGFLTISDSQLYGATRTALYVFNDIAVTSSGNLYRSNIYGARLNMDCTMTSTGDTFSANSNSGIYLESTSDLVIVDGTVRGNSVGIKAEDASTVLAWATTVEECSFEGYKITESDLIVHDGEMLNCTGGGIVAPVPSTAEWVVHPGNSSRLLDSDVYLTEDLVIHGDTVLHDSTVVFPDYASPSYVGVGVDEGHQDWQNMTFRPATTSGAIIFRIEGPVTGSAWYVTVQDAAANNVPAESPVVNAAIEFHRCTFRDSTNGLIVLSDQVVLDRCTFTGNTNGVSVDGVEVRFENCTFTSNSATDVVPTNGGHAVLVNSSFTPSMVVPSGPGDTWSAWWTVHVKVKFPSGGAAAGALVVVRDTKGATVFTGTANDDGFIANILILEHVTTGTVRDARSPHTFNASLGASDNEGTTDVTGHGLVTIEIADGSPPDLTITSHSDGDHVRTSTLVLQGTAFDAGSSVYRVEARIATQAWQTCSGTDTWEWTTSLPGDGTYPISVRARDIAFNEMTVYLNITL
ncbi:MAG: right-handed parallel beta-helix repeat-containing protein, partial [Thermoplasmata archaeon]